VLIGVALVTAVALLASTLKAQVREIFSEQFVGDFVVKTDDFSGFGGLSPDLADQINELPEVSAAAGIGVKLAEVDGKGATVTLVDPKTVGEVFDLHLTSGSRGSHDVVDVGLRQEGQVCRSPDRRRVDSDPHRSR
jgi:putative ABC transport system permease protein